MYNYLTRFAGSKKQGVYQDLFLNIRVWFSDNPNYEKIRDIYHDNLINIISTIRLTNGTKRFVKEYKEKTNVIEHYQELSKEIYKFFDLLNLTPILSKQVYENNKLDILDIKEKDKVKGGKEKNHQSFSGYKKIKHDYLNEVLLQLFKHKRLYLNGLHGSGKTMLLLELADFLQSDEKIVFYFKTIEQFKKQILNFLFLGDNIPNHIKIDSIYKSIDKEDTFIFIDDYSENSPISHIITGFTDSKIIVSGNNNINHLSYLKKITYPSFGFNELKKIFFWSDEKKLLGLYKKYDKNILKLKKELIKNYKIRLNEEEQKSLIKIFFSGKTPSNLKKGSLNKLINNYIIEKDESSFTLEKTEYINPKILINHIKNKNPMIDYKKAISILPVLTDKKDILFFYKSLPTKLQMKLINKIDLEQFPDNILRKLLEYTDKQTERENRKLKILKAIKKKRKEEYIKIIDAFIESNDYKEALKYFAELKQIDISLQIKKVKLLRLTGEFSKAFELLKQIKKDKLTVSQQAVLTLEEGLLYYSLKENHKARKMFETIIGLKRYDREKEIKNKALIYIGYLNREKIKKNLNHLFMLYINKLKENEFYELGEISSDIGQIYYKKYELDKALNWFKISSYYFEKIEHKKTYTLAGFNMGEVLKEKGELEYAQEIITKAYEMDIETGNSYSISIDLLSLAEIAFFQERYDLSLIYLEKIKNIYPNKNITKSFPIFYDINGFIVSEGKNINDSSDNGFFNIIDNIESSDFIIGFIKENSENLFEELKLLIFLSRGINIINKKLPNSILNGHLKKAEKYRLNFYIKSINFILFGNKIMGKAKYRLIENFLSEYYGDKIKIDSREKIVFGDNFSIKEKQDIKIIINKLINNTNKERQSQETDIIGFETTLQNIKEWCDKIKNLPYSVLIYGESGAGKELLAKYIHKTGIRSDKPFTSLNCAAIPSELIESILFGYKRGAFTGARENNKGLIRETDGGTLFLDEIGELPLGMQAKLLRVIQEKEVIGLGENKPIKIDVRFIFATNRKLRDDVAKGRFREDLFYRVNELRVDLPPLRKRKEDIPLLVRYFIKKHRLIIGKENIDISKDAINILSDYSWEGNIRELETEIKRALIRLEEGEYQISPEHLSKKILGGKKNNGEYQFLPLKKAKAEWEKKYLLSIINNKKGVSKKTIAKKLGLSRMQLYNLMKKYDIL
jgi:transcriptional regulator with PAS, ATPase and Fis domain/energy-coupling factor transporter ATP-binding protein EcfA2